MSYFLVEDNLLKKYNGPGGHVVIPEGITKVDPWVFYDCTNITGVTIPNSLTEPPIINNKAHFDVFTTYHVHSNHPCFATVDGVLFNKSKDALIHVPTGKTGIYKIPDGVQYILSNAFLYCMVSEVIIPDGVKKIGLTAFSNCCNLNKVTLPYTVEVISSHAFDKLPQLQSLIFPPKISHLFGGAVSSCKNLINIEFKSDDIVLNDRMFIDMDNLECITLSVDKELSQQPYYKFPLAVGIIQKKYNGQFVDEKVWLSVIQYINRVKALYDWENIVPHHLFLLQFLFDENILTEEMMDTLLDNANSDKNTELISKLLNIRESLYPSSQKFERLKAKMEQEIKKADRHIRRKK